MKSHAVRALHVVLLVLTAAYLGEVSTLASSFTISAPSMSAQTLGSGAGQTGTVTESGTVTVSGSTVAVTISGNSATLTNLGTISQTGTGRVIRDNTGVTSLMITNGSLTNSTALMVAADADVIQMNKTPASVRLDNYGTLRSDNASAGGNQAVDFSAILSGSNVVNNFSGGLLKATEADAVRPGANGVVNNSGTILSVTTTGSSSDGVDMQNNSGLNLTNAANWNPATPATPGTGLIEGGRHGITGGAADATATFTASITNNLGGVIQGDNGAGINLDGFNAKQTVTISNSGRITGNGITGDGDGVDVDSVVNLTNSGIIRSINAFSGDPDAPAQSEGVTIGGGTIVNSGTIEGLVTTGNTNAVGRGITLAGVDTSGSPEAIYANSTITNLTGGLIKGQSDSAIIVQGPASGFTVVINNNVGATVLGGGAATAAIQTGADNDTINNAGAINGASSKKAIDMGGGNNTLNITGGAASIVGNISGGIGGTNTMTIDPGAGSTFSYAGSLSNFSSVETKSGTVTFSGNNTYTGTTTVSGGTLVAAGIGGSKTLGATSAITVTNGGTLALGASEQINDLAALAINGGTFDLDDFSEGAAGVNGLGILTLFGDSTLDFGSLLGLENDVQFGGFLNGVGSTVVLNVLDFDFGIDHLYFGLPSAATFDATADPFANLVVCFDGRFCGYNVVSMSNSLGSFLELQANDPVPEPATFALLGMGLAVIGLRVRRSYRR